MKPYQLIAVLGLLGFPLIGGSQHLPRRAFDAGAACVARQGGSRWVEQASRFTKTHAFGSGGPDSWLGDIGGVAATEEWVFVLDKMRGSVLRLSPLLVKEAEYGRLGNGPGEYSSTRFLPFLPRYWDFSFVGAASETVVMYDEREVEVYDVSGEFVDQMRVQNDPSFIFGVRYVEPLDRHHSIVVMDSIDRTGDRPRRLQTWLVEKEGSKQQEALLWEVPLPWKTGPARFTGVAREARPFWARRGGCHVASDGASPFLWRYSADGGGLDSLALPSWDVPEFGDDPDDRFISPFSDKRSGPVEFTALIRWTDLSVDPDGWVWVKAWTKDRGKEIIVFAVSIETGEVIQIAPPFFPRAFGEPGVAYAIEVNPDTDEQLIVRYEAMIGGPQ